MSNKHETALALVDEQIEKEERQLAEAEMAVHRKTKELESVQKERELIAWSLGQLRASRTALMFDRAANNITPEPSEVP